MNCFATFQLFRSCGVEAFVLASMTCFLIREMSLAIDIQTVQALASSSLAIG